MISLFSARSRSLLAGIEFGAGGTEAAQRLGDQAGVLAVEGSGVKGGQSGEEVPVQVDGILVAGNQCLDLRGRSRAASSVPCAENTVQYAIRARRSSAPLRSMATKVFSNVGASVSCAMARSSSRCSSTPCRMASR